MSTNDETDSVRNLDGLLDQASEIAVDTAAVAAMANTGERTAAQIAVWRVTHSRLHCQRLLERVAAEAIHEERDRCRKRKRNACKPEGV